MFTLTSKPHCDGQDDAHSSYPFNLYDLLKKKKKHDNGNGDQRSEDNLKFPPGFTPKDDTNVYSKSLNKSEGEFEEGMNEVDSDVREKVSMQRSKEETHGSTCSGYFKKVEFTRSGGSILNLMDELVKVGQTMGYKMEGCIKNIEEIIESQGVNEDPRLFRKTSYTISDYFVILRGQWIPNGNRILIMSIYAPQELSKKKRLWDYLNHVIANWNREVIIMGDFNEVRTQAERYGSMFNVQGVDALNLFISSAGLVEVPLDGCSFTWCHKSAFKMSKIDRFLISEVLMESCPNISYKGDANSDILNQRMHVVKSLQDLDKLESLKVAQKAKIKWSIEGDENSKYYHGILNKKRSQLAIRDFPFELSLDQRADMERDVSMEEIKRAAWDCGLDKSPRPGGFTFGFYRRYWGFLESDVVEAVTYFFQYGSFPKGGNSSFIALIPKMQDAKLVKDFRPISLIGSLYKIVSKILVNRMVVVLGELVNEVHSAFVANRQILDGPFIIDELLNLLQVLECFYRASGLRINMNKSKLMGIKVDMAKVDRAAQKIGCMTFRSPFSYLGIKVGGSMSRTNSWDEIVNKLLMRLSKWKMKTLSIGGRLTLIKSVLGSTPIYYMSMFKVPMQVFKKIESIRCHFFNGVEYNVKKPMLVKWNNVLASKEKGGLGVSSFYALNRALMFKWVWRFRNQDSSLWARVIKVVHGENGKLCVHLVRYCSRCGSDKELRVYSLETVKNIYVASKLSHEDMGSSLRRSPRGGAEQAQFSDMCAIVEGTFIAVMRDRWVWTLDGSGEFSVASVRRLLDDSLLPEVSSKTRWINAVPIKVNVHAWKVSLDCLPTRINISRRGIEIDSILCPNCGKAAESTSHIFF
nr:RNA-directed DNA polymerase, eukaryota, reverse transcriptase zinc-binding domain protein [Tanacetum cinerariifolium]